MADLIEVTTVATSIENGSFSLSDLQIIFDTYKNGARFKVNTNKDFEYGKIITIDFSGRTINSFNFTKNEITNEFILVDLIPGLYITSLILDQEPISTKKFVILK